MRVLRAVGLSGAGETGVLGTEVERDSDGLDEAVAWVEMLRDSFGLADLATACILAWFVGDGKNTSCGFIKL